MVSTSKNVQLGWRGTTVDTQSGLADPGSSTAQSGAAADSSTSTTYVWGVGTQPTTNTYSVENGLQTITVGIYSPDAPSLPAAQGVNLAPFFAGLAPYDPGLAALQTLGIGVGGAALASGGVALAPALKGPALAALLELTSSQINKYVAEEVVTTSYAQFLQGLEQLNIVLKALEVPEVVGPPILW